MQSDDTYEAAERRGRSPETGHDPVDEGSEDSFPASDPPAHTPARTGQPRRVPVEENAPQRRPAPVRRDDGRD